MRITHTLALLLIACSGNQDDTATTTRFTAPEVSTDPAETALSSEDVSVVIDLDAEGPGQVTYTYLWTAEGQTWNQPRLPATATTKGEEWTVTVTPYAGDQSGPAGSSTVSILNTPPVLTGASFEPAAPTLGTPLRCVPDASDFDDDPLTYTYRWELDGVDAGNSNDTLPSALVTPQTVISCAVTATDGEATTDEVVITGQLDNTPPTLDGATITPPSPLSTQEATCVPGTPFDAEGASVTYTYAWFVNGVDVGVSDRVLAASYYQRDDQLVCVVTPSDGLTTGESVNSSTATVRNSGPTIEAVAIAPQNPTASTSLECSPTATDPDNDTLSYTYRWLVSGTTLAETSSLLLPGSLQYQDIVVCEATATDGEYEDSMVSDFVVVGNTPPQVTGITITPAAADTTQGLTCDHGSTSDVDGQSVTVTYAWTVDGAAAGSGSTLTAGSAARGQTVVCTATPNDGTDDGSSISTSIVIGNAAPGAPTLSISPSAPTEADDIDCVAEAIDPDGDNLNYDYAWFVGATQVSANATLPAGTVARGELARCEATATDGTATGPLATLEITPGNQLPVIDSVTLDPTTAQSGDTITCTATASDGDGDSLTTSYAWTRNGVALGVTSASLDGTSVSFVFGDVLVCRVTVQDEFSSVTASSDPLSVGNTAPTLDSVNVGPAGANTTQGLTCSSGNTSDPDGQAVSVNYEWFVDGTSVGTGSSLAAFTASRGQTVRCVGTPSDGVADGDSVEASLVIGNAPPAEPTVSLLPIGVHGGDQVSCIASSTDPDDDVPTYTFEWFLDDVLISTADTLSPGFGSRGQTLRCDAIPSDGTDTGPTGSGSVVLANEPPTIDSITVDPFPSAGPTAPISCVVDAFDGDADPLDTTYVWLLNGLVTSVTNAEWSGALVVGDSLTCRATVADDQYSDTRTATPIAISNTLPEVSGVAVTPADPSTTDVLTCAYDSLTDPDGQSLTASFRWVIDGDTVGTSATLAAGTAKDTTVTCEVTPNDGVDDGPVGSSEVVIRNTIPSYTGVTLTPATGAVESSTLTCAEAGETDPDNDVVTPTYRWFRDGELLADATGNTLDGADFSRGNSLRCDVTPNDGEADGTTVTSNDVAIENTPPTGGTVSLTPPLAATLNTLTCSAGGATDADDDSVSYDYAWLRNGQPISGQTEALLSSSLTAKDETYVCVATPTDGTDDGAPLNSVGVVIQNSAPIGGTATVSPSAPKTGEDLTCQTTAATDADDDLVNYTYTWRENGAQMSGQNTGTLPASATSFGNTYACVATPNDGEEDGTPVVSDAVGLENTPPEGGTATLGPALAYTDTSLTCTGADATDADNDPITYDITWQRNGSTILGQTGTTLPIAETEKGQSITCEATPTDGRDDGTPVRSNAVEILNTVPTGATATIDPPIATTSNDLVCLAANATDPDIGDSISYTYRWFRGGVVISGQTSRSLPSDQTARDQVITCEVTPFDGEQSGSSVTSASRDIRNSAPTGGSATLEPQGPAIDDDLRCIATGSTDADNDPVSYEYAWFEGSSLIEGQESSVLSSIFTATDRSYTCVVTPTDGDASGPAFDSNSVSIGNSAPTGGTATLDTEVAYTDTVLSCEGSGATDLDGDLVSYLYAWRRNGVLIPGQTDTTLPASETTKGQTIACEVTPTDGTDNGAPVVSDSVLILNSLPTGASAAIAQSSPQTGTNLTCNAFGATDADNDPVTYEYRWRRNGIVITNQTSATLSAGLTAKDQTFACEATPTDGSGLGSPVWSSDVVIQNTAPVVRTATVDPQIAFEGSTLTCLPDADDADEDNLTFTVTWYVNNVEVLVGDELTGARFRKNDQVYCEVVASDGSAPSEPVQSEPIAIRNTAPVLTGAVVSPTPAREGSTLSCVPSGSDADGDDLDYDVLWYINETTEVRSPTLTGVNFNKADTIFCRIQAYDGTATSNVATSEPIVVQNTPPSITSVGLSPDTPTVTVTSTMRCTYSGAPDADGDNTTPSFQWYKNGALISGQEGSTLSNQFVRSDKLECRVRLFDGQDYSAWVASPNRVVENSPPVVDFIAIDPPQGATATSTLTCQVALSDPDGDPLSVVIFRWFVNGGVVQEGNDQKLTGFFSRGDQVWCEVYAEDELGAFIEKPSAPVQILNSAPVMGTVSISTFPYQFNETWTCTGTGTDVDTDDTLNYSYRWQEYGNFRWVTLSTASQTFSPISGQTYRCGISVSDGELASGYTYSSSVLCNRTTCPDGGILQVTGRDIPPGRLPGTLDGAITLSFDPTLDRACEVIVDVVAWDGATETWERRWSGATMDDTLTLDSVVLRDTDRLDVELFGCEDEIYEVSVDGEWMPIESRGTHRGTVWPYGMSSERD